MLDDALGVLLHGLAEALELEAAEVARVAPVLLVLRLDAREDDLVGVDDHDKITGVGVGRELRLVLAAQNHRRRGGQTTKRGALGVDEHPLALDFAVLGELSRLLHLTPPTYLLSDGFWTNRRAFVRDYGALWKSCKSIQHRPRDELGNFSHTTRSNTAFSHWARRTS